MLSRRALLATLGGSLVGGAGCATRERGPGTTTRSTTAPPSGPRTTGESPTPTDPTAESGVEVSDIVARKAVRYESIMGSGGVLVGEDRQYVVASVRSADVDDLEPSAFAFLAGGREWSPGLPDTAGAVNVSIAGHEGSPVGRGQLVPDAPAVLAFTLPSPLSASNPRIRFDGERTRTWSLPATARDRLAAPAARFALGSLSAPASISQGVPLPVSVTVTNVSETTGRFLAAVYWPTTIADDDESHVLERVVGTGETTTLSMTVDTARTTNEAGPVTLTVRGHVSAEREIRVEEVSTPD